VALEAVDEIRPLVPEGVSMAQFALRWILMNEGVTTVIPGAKNPEQAKANCAASELPPLTEPTMAALRALYLNKIAPFVHHQW
jgi:aryl-alcohol dehydrogenase-like predicted oxidoreductase